MLPYATLHESTESMPITVQGVKSGQSKRIIAAFVIMYALIAIVLTIGFITVVSGNTQVSSNIGISSHVLDQVKGIPASGVPIELYLYDGNSKEFKLLSKKVTNTDGRVDSFLDQGQFIAGKYKAAFNVEPYFEQAGVPYFYPTVDIVFIVKNNTEHYHVPLLLCPFGYSTYRGS